MEASPSPALIMPEPDLLLEVLIIALDAPAHFDDVDEAAERHLLVDGCKPILGRLGLAGRPFDEQRLFSAFRGPPDRSSAHPQAGKARAQGLVGAFPPGDCAPRVLGQAERQ